jgi:hypothetical protein
LFGPKVGNNWGSGVILKGNDGILPNGSVNGVTPYWNGQNWIVNSTNLFNNGSRMGIGTTIPVSKLSVSDSVPMVSPVVLQPQLLQLSEAIWQQVITAGFFL